LIFLKKKKKKGKEKKEKKERRKKKRTKNSAVEAVESRAESSLRTNLATRLFFFDTASLGLSAENCRRRETRRDTPEKISFTRSRRYAKDSIFARHAPGS
jgi:hypothetical protein